MTDLFGRIDDRLERWKYERTKRRLERIAEDIIRYTVSISHYSRDDVYRASARLQEQLKIRRTKAADFAVEAFAIASQAAYHILDFYPNSTQLIAAIILAEDKIMELRSGEGKTLVAMLTAYWQAIRGRHVDIATTNDYLARRDQQWMGLVYGILGISTGLITSKTPERLRKSEYQKQVTYVANQELAFDYLRDHLALSQEEQVSGPLDFLIIDEADSILIDEARTAFIISGPPVKEENLANYQRMRRVLEIVKKLTPEDDYTIDYARKSVALTEEGTKKIAAEFGGSDMMWKDSELTRSLWYVLYASVFLKENRDYMVQDGRVMLVDEFTGHSLPDRVLLDDLQEAVEAKAGLEPSGSHSVIASITYLNFFKLYKNISGMTGTAYDAREDFFNLYKLGVFPISPHRRPQRQDLPTIFFRTKEEKLAKVVQQSLRAPEWNAAFLIVARSIDSALECQKALEKAGVPHQILHAAVSEKEDEIIQSAGKSGMITIATNMAGRGADIIIAESIRYSRGLHILGLEHNLSRRVDDQLRGRAGRQGQTGKTQFFASLEDEILWVHADDKFWDYAEGLQWSQDGISDDGLYDGLKKAQEKAERIASEQRLSLARFDSIIDNHRSAVYELYRLILLSPDYLNSIFDALRKIIVKEEFSALTSKEIASLFETEISDKRLSKLLIAIFIHGKKSRFADLFGAIPAASYEEHKRTALKIVTAKWQNYLASVDWLQDWISLTYFAEKDPYVAFAETADRMFHDMRRDLSMSIIRDMVRLIQ